MGTSRPRTGGPVVADEELPFDARTTRGTPPRRKLPSARTGSGRHPDDSAAPADNVVTPSTGKSPKARDDASVQPFYHQY
ncbi:hypothetical protein GCM10027563_03980 [Parasphingorhabdus pacifica]